VPDLVAAAAVAVAFAAGLGAGYTLWSTPPQQQQSLMELATVGLDAHRIYAVEIRHPVEVGADEEQHLVTWLTKRLDTAVKAPNLSGEGLRLLGGRLIPSGDKPAALLMYEGESGERYSLLVAREPAAKMTAFRYAESGTIGAFYWIDGSTGYALSGPADRNRLLRVARAIYEQLDN
jgi:anti-sigma factor RsiW